LFEGLVVNPDIFDDLTGLAQAPSGKTVKRELEPSGVTYMEKKFASGFERDFFPGIEKAIDF